MSAVQFHDLSAHVQTDACASGMPAIVEVLVFEAEELVEDAGPECSGHTRSGVGHADRDRPQTAMDGVRSPSSRRSR